LNVTLKKLLPLLICVAWGCRPAAPASPAPKASEAPVEVKTVHPVRREITRGLVLPGNILPNQQVTLFAKVPGYLQKIAVDQGDAVKQGDVIATIEAPELIADQAKFKADLEIAQIDFQRISKAQEKAPDLVVAQSIDTARAKFLAAKANLERAETLLGFTRISAPFAGMVTRRFVDAGAFIPAATSSSAPQNAAIVTLMDFSVVRVQVAVPEHEVPPVKVGLPATLTIDELPGRQFEGKISRYSHALDEMKTMLVEIDLPNTKGELLPGMYVKAKIGIEKKADALVLPVDAVVMEKANASAFTVVNGKAKKTPLKIGFNDGTNIEVVTGLGAEDQAIVVGKRTFSDGQPVKVVEGK
jgi:membrane fusion protein (multidrug efflux system)